MLPSGRNGRDSSDSLVDEYWKDGASSTTSTEMLDLLGSSDGKQVLHINTRGLIMMAPFKTPPSDASIYSGDEMVYAYSRGPKGSEDARLEDTRTGEFIVIKYKFGPGREPEIKYLDKDKEHTLKVSGHVLKRGFSFIIHDRKLEWGYHKIDGRRELVLSTGGLLLAVLKRGKNERTPGATDKHAGSGGMLLIEKAAGSFIGESLIVATCLMMLKKEIDRRRTCGIDILTSN